MLGIITNTKMNKILALSQEPCDLTAHRLLDRISTSSVDSIRVMIGIKEARKVGWRWYRGRECRPKSFACFQ